MSISIGCIWHSKENYTNVYIGRSGKGKEGNLGNPFTAKQYGLDRCLELYECYLNENIHLLQPLKEKIRNGENLLLQCFCKKTIDDDTKCHGDVIKKLLKV